MRKPLSIALGLCVTGAALVYAFQDIDVAALWEVSRSGNTWIFLPFLSLLSVFYLLNALRWSLSLRPFGRFSPWQVVPSMMIGFAGNNVLPMRLGELIRTVLFAREFNQPKMGVLMTLVLDRALDLFGILFVYVVGLALLESTVPPVFRLIAVAALAGVLVLAAALILFLRYGPAVRRLWGVITREPSPSVYERGLVYIGYLEQGLSSLKSPALVSALILATLLRWLIAAAMTWLCVLSFGTPVSAGLAMLLMGVTAFASSLPSAPGFIGPVQAAFVFALTPFGISPEVAFAASAMFLLGHWVPATAVGAFFFLSRHYSFKGVRRECEALESA